MNIITSMGHWTDHWMSTYHISVQSIELLQRGCKGHWGMYGYMYMGCYTNGDLFDRYWYRGMCRGLHWDIVYQPDLRLVLWVRQVAVAACMSLSWRFCVLAMDSGLMYAYSRSWCCNDKPMPSCLLSQNIGNAKSGCHGMGVGGVTVISTWPLTVIRAVRMVTSSTLVSG